MAHDFQLRETLCDEEMTYVEPELDVGLCFLHFQLPEPLYGHLGPKLSNCASTGFFMYFIVYMGLGRPHDVMMLSM